MISIVLGNTVYRLFMYEHNGKDHTADKDWDHRNFSFTNGNADLNVYFTSTGDLRNPESFFVL
jgi:hypothetical protein